MVASMAPPGTHMGYVFPLFTYLLLTIIKSSNGAGTNTDRDWDMHRTAYSRCCPRPGLCVVAGNSFVIGVSTSVAIVIQFDVNVLQGSHFSRSGMQRCRSPDTY